MTSTAFALDYSGPRVRCDFPRCTLDSFHEGDHHLAPIEREPAGPIFTCAECGSRFVIYGRHVTEERRTCGEQACILRAARRHANTIPLSCRCRQREYAHDLSVHLELRAESYNPTRRHQWPWALMLSIRLEPSTELRAA